MAQKDWKFHDFDMLLNHQVKLDGGRYERFPVVYRLTRLRPGSQCLLCGDRDDGRWYRKTKNEGMNGSVRYASYPNLTAAMDAAIKWARRKDEEAVGR